MSSDDQTSPILTHLLDGLAKLMPLSAAEELDAYRAKAAALPTSSSLEWHRAFTCAQWAAATVELPEHNALQAKARKALEVVKEVAQVVRSQYENVLQIWVREHTSPAYEVEITWVFEAVDVAGDVAGKVGWDQTPWRQLIDTVLAVTTDDD